MKSDKAIQVIDHNGYTIKVFPDDIPENPRTNFPHLGRMLYTSSRYELGDDRVSSDVIDDILKREDVFALPVYAFIHGNVVLHVQAFEDRFDSGQSGVIYCERKDANAEYPELSGNDLQKKVFERFKAEVEEFSHYLNGEVYGFEITEPHGITEHSCWGFYSIEDCIEDAKLFADENPVLQACGTFEGNKNCCVKL